MHSSGTAGLSVPQIHRENEVVIVDLPEGWVDRSDGDELAFENPGESEDLIVSLGHFKKPMDANTLAEVVGKLLEHKAAAFGQISAGTFRIQDAFQPPAALPYVAGFSGYDGKNAIYSSVKIFASVDRFFSASYYVHGCKIVTSDTGTRAQAVLAMCQLSPHGR
jgi:hypothetical protein